MFRKIIYFRLYKRPNSRRSTRDFQNKQISEKNHISDYARIIEQVYKSETPSKYLGSLAPFILKHYNNPYIKEIVDNNIRSFFRRLLIPLLERNIPKQCSIKGEKLPIGIMGGFGLTCKEILKNLWWKNSMRKSRHSILPY